MRVNLIIAVPAAAALALAGCGSDDEQPAPTVVVAPAEQTTTSAPAPAPAEEPAVSPEADADPPPSSGPAESAGFDPRVTALERAAGRTVRDYVGALDGRDGAAACALLAPGAVDAVELPVRRGGCARSLGASIGFRDPRGLPVWEGARVADLVSVEIGDGSAKVVATVVTEFADRDEASIEDDVVYLERAGRGWRVAKPSATLYRAVGIADVPPSVLAPPD